MTYDKEYARRSDTQQGFKDKARKLEKESFDGRVSPTGYTDTLMGMDDMDRIRKTKLNKLVND